MSDTPRTDAALEWVRPAGDDSAPPNEQYVSADFARDLERELTQLRKDLELRTAERDGARAERNYYAGEVTRLRDALAKSQLFLDDERRVMCTTSFAP